VACRNMRKKAMSTAIAPNVADSMSPKWWTVRDFHTGFSLTAVGQCQARQSVAWWPTCFMLVYIALAV
jgi:hypothetical protein